MSTVQSVGKILSMTTITQSKPERIHESAGEFDKVDRASGRIRGVRVIGLKSKNGRRYLREAIQSALPLYEGARVYLNHRVEGERPTRERWGKLINVREAEDGGLIADLDYLTKHPETEATLEAIEKFRDMGLSHDSLGRSRMEGGERVVYEIVKVNSVDLVENPATTENLWESEMKSKRVKFLAVLRENRAEVAVANKFLDGLMEMSKNQPEIMQEMGLDDMEVDMEQGPEITGDDAVKAALRQAILAVLDGPDDSATTMKKIKTLMDVGDKLANPVAPPVGDVAPVDETPIPDEEMPESVRKLVAGVTAKAKEIDRVLESVRARETELKSKEDNLACRSLLESKGRDINDERLRLLGSVAVGDRDALVESWPRAVSKPAASRPRYTQADASATPGSYAEVRSKVRAIAKK